MTIRSALLAASFAFALVGPASAQDAGSRMSTEAGQTSDRADDQADLAKQWKKGEKMAAKGHKLIRKSQAQVSKSSRDASKHQARADRAMADGRKAEALLAEGQRMVQAGALLKGQAEHQFPLVPGA